jgi:hypothetical protein
MPAERSDMANDQGSGAEREYIARGSVCARILWARPLVGSGAADTEGFDGESMRDKRINFAPNEGVRGSRILANKIAYTLSGH